MTLAALIRKKEPVRFATATPATPATVEDDMERTVATVATFSVEKPPETKSATASRWWLIHYPDGAPVEVWTSPLATHAEILERHPEAIAVEPITQMEPEPAQNMDIGKVSSDIDVPQEPLHTSCDTCCHVTGRGGCGEPVAAGLSDLDGVICYRSNGGKDCPAWLAVCTEF